MLYSDMPEFFDVEEISLFEKMTENISFALDVFERSKQRDIAEIALKKWQETFLHTEW